jgi:hypothetical protein
VCCSTDAQGRNEELNSKDSQWVLGMSSMSEPETALDSDRALNVDPDRSSTRSKHGGSVTGSWSRSNKQDSITVGISEDFKGIEYAEKRRFDFFERFYSFQQLVGQSSPQSETETVSVLCNHQAGAVEPIISDVDVLNVVLAEERARVELQKTRTELRRIPRLIGESRPQLLYYLGLSHAPTHVRQYNNDNGSCCVYDQDHGSDSQNNSSDSHTTSKKWTEHTHDMQYQHVTDSWTDCTSSARIHSPQTRNLRREVTVSTGTRDQEKLMQSGNKRPRKTHAVGVF